MQRLAPFWLCLLIGTPATAQDLESMRRTLAPVYAPLAGQIASDFDLREKRGTGIDLGSGPGDLVIELCRKTRWMHWVNADLDPRVFAGFLQRAEEAGFRGRVSAMQADAQALPFHDAFADIVVSRGSYPFWKDKRKAFAEVYRVLKPGGVAFIGRGFPESLPIEVARAVREKQRKSGKEPVYDIDKSAAELRQIMRSLEIEDFRIRIPKRGDVNYGIWLEFRKPAKGRMPPSLLERPGRESAGLEPATTVVEKAEIEAQNAQTPVDALQFVPGAWIESRGRKVKQFLSFRGQKYPYPEYAINGVLFREFHEVPYVLSAAEIERIEVMRSGTAMMAGNAGLVGLINVVPRQYEGRETAVKLEYGSFGTVHGRASHGGRLRDFSYGLGVDSYRTDGPENRHGEESITNYYAGLGWKPTNMLSLTTHLFHIAGSRGLVQALPPATRALQTTVEKFDPVQTSFGTLNALFQPNQRLTTQVLLGYSNRHNTDVATTAAGTTTSTRDWDRELTAGANQSVAVTRSNVLRIGTNYNHWVAPYGKRFYTGRRCDLETYSLVLTDEQRWGALVVDGGLRYHRTYIREYGAFNIDETAGPYRNVPAVKNQWERPAWSGNLGSAYFIREGLSVYGNLSMGSIEPRQGTLDGALQPPQKEERLVADLGFRLSNPRLGTATVSAFSVRRQNGINLSGLVRTVGGRPMELYENRDEDSKGVELDFRSRRFRNTLQVFLNLTAMRPRVQAGNAMQRDSEIPRAMAGGGLSASRWGFDLNAFWRSLSSYESLRFAEPAVPRRLGGFHNVDLMLGRRIGPRGQTRIYAGVWNVADKAYSTVVGYPDYGRRATIGMDYRF